MRLVERYLIVHFFVLTFNVDCGTMFGLFKKLRALYHAYRPYVRADLLMYGFFVLFIIAYAIYVLVS